jgi:hypothetical protein
MGEAGRVPRRSITDFPGFGNATPAILRLSSLLERAGWGEKRRLDGSSERQGDVFPFRREFTNILREKE